MIRWKKFTFANVYSVVKPMPLVFVQSNCSEVFILSICVAPMR